MERAERRSERGPLGFNRTAARNKAVLGPLPNHSPPTSISLPLAFFFFCLLLFFISPARCIFLLLLVAFHLLILDNGLCTAADFGGELDKGA